MHNSKSRKSVAVKIFKIIVLVVSLIVVAGVSNLIYLFNTSELDLYFDSKDVFHQVSDTIFEGVESGNIKVGEALNLWDKPERVESLGLKKQLNRLGRVNGIETIRVKDANMLWFVTPGMGHSISGVAITKNNIPPEGDDDYDKYDKGTLRYRRIDENTYFFSAGL